MGAEFCFSYIPYFNHSPERFEELRAIARRDEKELDKFEFRTLDEWRESLLGAIDDLEDIKDGNREVTVFIFKGMPYKVMLTGAMTWGDPPTDASVVFDKLSESRELWAKFEEWAEADYRASN